MLHANGALQDSLAVLETKITEANVIKCHEIMKCFFNFLLSKFFFFFIKYSIIFFACTQFIFHDAFYQLWEILRLLTWSRCISFLCHFVWQHLFYKFYNFVFRISLASYKKQYIYLFFNFKFIFYTIIAIFWSYFLFFIIPAALL